MEGNINRLSDFKIEKKNYFVIINFMFVFTYILYNLYLSLIRRKFENNFK